MLPFVIGGGILIALAFLFDMDNAGAANFGSGTPLAAFLKNVGGLSFSMMMPILAGYIAMSIGERPALMPGIVGGFLATTGGSGFFGALFAGFIAGYLIIFLKKPCPICRKLWTARSPSSSIRSSAWSSSASS